ncbi:hypothetical protein AB1Y20_018573 [Prymnesium parvum]|uniref:NADP-dependent oxidoreductase domain-containing protein n=1 Tax=Prymnesium parvum TaxID=97485 RepID=A0AB34JS90_PRYPA
MLRLAAAAAAVLAGAFLARRLLRGRLSAAPADPRTCLLSSGARMPLVGLGTWQAPRGEVGAAVSAALKCGYRHIDCAAIYGNEAEIGEALSAALSRGLARSALFVTSKLWNSEHAAAHVRAACVQTMRELQLEYLDLYLMHWPQQMAKTEGSTASIPRDERGDVKYARVPIIETWRAMEALVDEGLVKAIGVSNFNAKQLAQLCRDARIKPVCNQVESHPYFAQEALLEACRQLGVVMTAYSPLGSPGTGQAARSEDGVAIPSHPTLRAIGAKRGKSAAQVALAYQVARGVPTFPKTVKADRLAENLDVMNIVLTDAEMAEIRALDRGWAGRSCFAGPKVERNGVLEPRDAVHPDYPWNSDGTER